MEVKSCTFIADNELRRLVVEHIGDADFSFQADLDADNDSEHVFELADLWQDEIADWEVRGDHSQYARPAYYLAKLIEQGVIPAPHTIVVTVSY